METLALMGVIYLAPGIYAVASHRKNAAAIFVLNLLLGWTFLGWVAALIWAMVSPKNDDGNGPSLYRKPKAPKAVAPASAPAYAMN